MRNWKERARDKVWCFNMTEETQWAEFPPSSTESELAFRCTDCHYEHEWIAKRFLRLWFRMAFE